MARNVTTRIIMRNDTAAAWEAVKDSATLLPGEIGIEKDTGLFKVGREKSHGVGYTWAELPYVTDGDLTVETVASLPATGLAGITYYVKEDNSIRRWNGTSYDIFGGDGSVVEDVTVDNIADLPQTGTEGVTYYVKEDNSIRRWNTTNNTYDIFGGTVVDDELEIEMINGGNANVTN